MEIFMEHVRKMYEHSTSYKENKKSTREMRLYSIKHNTYQQKL